MLPRSKPMPYGVDFQKAIIRLMMLNPVFCSKALDQLKPTDFTGELSWFFETIKNNYRGSVPTKENISADICKHSADKQIVYYRVLDEICAVVPDYDRVTDAMTNFIRANVFVDTCREAVSLYNSEQHQKAYDLTNARMAFLNRVNFGTDGNSRFNEPASAIAAMAQAEKDGAIPTGIHKIDFSLGGGLLPGTWTTFLGSTNAGKSMLMPSLAKQAALSGKRTFVTIHEDEEVPTKIRYLSCFSEIAYEKIAYGWATLTQEELQRIEAAQILLRDHVVLRFMYTTESTVERVMDQARILMREWPFHLFLCDYGQCLTSHDFKKLDSVRHLQEHVYHMLKQLCLELKIPGAGGAQVNRTANTVNQKGEEYLRVTDVAEAFGIVKKSSNVITMNRSTEDSKQNRIVFLLDKCRNGRVGVAVECESDYSKCMVYTTDPVRQVDVSDKIEKGPKNRSEDSEIEAEIKTLSQARTGKGAVYG